MKDDYTVTNNGGTTNSNVVYSGKMNAFAQRPKSKAAKFIPHGQPMEGYCYAKDGSLRNNVAKFKKK